MAYLRELAGECEGPEPGRSCPRGRRAAVAVVDRWNVDRWHCCRQCARRRLAELEAAEARAGRDLPDDKSK